MLESVIGAYLERVSEREFDEPFMAILRGRGYQEVHFLHGQVEFGKDFIAQGERDGARMQFSFQTKAGNLNLDGWNGAKLQIEMIRTNPLAHPAYDATLPRVGILVTTGRLTGPALLEAQQYEAFARANGFRFELWDRDKLVEILIRDPDVGLASGTTAPFLALASTMTLGKATDREIEHYSRNWISTTETPERRLYQDIIEAAVLANHANGAHRVDLACVCAYALLRAASTALHGNTPEPPGPLEVRAAAVGLFKYYALELWERCRSSLPTPNDLILSHANELGIFLTYPVRCMRIAEILGLLALRMIVDDDAHGAEVANYVADFILAQPGTGHPISDRWAVSLVPALLAIHLVRPTSTARQIELVTSWTCDWYDTSKSAGNGLAGADATPEDEGGHLLGGLLRAVSERRAESYVETVVLDLCFALGLDQTYWAARNDFLAVDAIASVIEFDDVPEQYQRASAGLYLTPNVDYPEHLQDRAPQHHTNPESVHLIRVGRPWDLIVISCLLRDRHWVLAMAELARAV